jgi:hypothetical protein
MTLGALALCHLSAGGDLFGIGLNQNPRPAGVFGFTGWRRVAG